MNEDKYLKNLSDQSKKVSLSENEKQIMKSEVLEFMKNNPMQGVNVGWSLWPIFQRPVLRYASMVAVLSLVIFSGVSLAANNSLPGDVLYPIKVGVNEKVLGLLQVSDESKAQYDIQLAETRLEEIEKVSSKENLNESTKANISSLLNKHIEDAKKHSDKVGNQNNNNLSAQINSELEASLNAHKDILDELSKEKDSRASENIKEVLSNVNENINKVKKDRQEGEDMISNKSSSDVQQSAEGKLKSAQNKIDEVSNFIEGKKSSLSSESYDSAKANIKLANDTISQGQNELQARNYGKSFSLFQKAIRIAQQTKISIQASINLEINVPGIKDQGEDGNGSDSQINSHNGQLKNLGIF